MQRAPIVLSATVAGLAATLGFQARAPAAAPTAAAQTATTPGASPTATATTATTATAASTTATGAVAANQYGNVQLKVTVKAGRITKVEAVQLPAGDPKSAEINAYAEPLLTQSALSKQSAGVDAVSGATYTTDSYRTALQSALDKANVTTTTTSGA
jgi:uncharacterized protein with FMN-binding domain